jgi:hypothetical protein
MTCEDKGLIERLLGCEKNLEKCDNESQSWTDALEELSEIEDAFVTDENNRLDGKTILDIGTDCVKPLYIALKFHPDKIIGINEELSYSYTSDIEQKSKLFAETKIRFYNCSLFDKETLNRILKKEKVKNGFGFVLVSKTLHHLRTGVCSKKERDDKHKHQKDETETCCIYGFNEQMIFKKLFELGKRVIVYETFFPQEKDEDKVRGRGGYFTTTEWGRIFAYLSGKYRVEFIRPERFHLDKKESEKIAATLRKVDYICFYVEEQDVKDVKDL